MNFKTKNIEAQYIGMIDIGTYKIRVGICKVLNRNVELIGYGEKRQDSNDSMFQEIKNLESVCENIQIAIEKAEADAKFKVSDYMINLPTSNIFFESSNLNYVREQDKKKIDEQEMKAILREIEINIFRNHYRRICSSSGYSKSELELIISNIGNISIDSSNTKSLLGKEGKNIYISVLNIFITKNKSELKAKIAKSIGKNISKIIPSEYALLGLFPQNKNIVIIDIGNVHTSIIVKSNFRVQGVKKLSFGMNDFIKIVRGNYKLTYNEIIRKIDEDIFLLEKEEFLKIFEDIIIIALEDILKYEVCPHNFFIIGGGANKFIKKYIEEINFNKYNLRMQKKVQYIQPKIDFIDDKITENPEWIYAAKSNINIYAMIRATLDFIKKEKNTVERTVKEIVKELN